MSKERDKNKDKNSPMLLGFDDLSTIPPTFFIGLGGSGSRVIHSLAQRLENEPNWSRFRNLIHFICIDTDRDDLSRLSRVSELSNISIPYKRRRIQLYRGELEHGEKSRITSWVHPWYSFREGSGAKGAGQIRLESRFSLHCQIEDNKPKNVRNILVNRLRSALNVKIATLDKVSNIRFFIYGSLAGGTGSGTALPISYLVRKLARDAGASSEVFGMLFLPSVFRHDVKSELHSKIDANAYAALKELEYCMEMRYETGPPALEFIFDPLSTRGDALCRDDYVEEAPFDWVYIVDKPEKATVEQIYQAAGETAYLQLFSPILAIQTRASDNYHQLLSEPLTEYFCGMYGSMGASVLEFPRDRLARYFARRKCIEMVKRFIVGCPKLTEGGDEVDVTSKAFREVSDSEQNRLLDQNFRSFIEQEARAEEDDPNISGKGLFSEIGSLKLGDIDLIQEFKARLNQKLDELTSKIELSTINAAALTYENPTLNYSRVSLARDYKAGKRLIDKEAIILCREISSGRFFAKFFSEFRVTPLQQRYFLIVINEMGKNEDLRTGDEAEDEDLLDWCFIPAEDTDGSSHLARKIPDRLDFDPDHPEVKKRINQLEERLKKASRKLLGKESAFNQARNMAVSSFKRFEETAYDALIIDFWHQINRSLQQQSESRMNTFRIISKQGLALVEHLRSQAERTREHGGVIPPIGETQKENFVFHLGNEVFHDARANVRQWHLVYKLKLEHEPLVDSTQILGQISAILDEAARSKSEIGDSESVLTKMVELIDKVALERVKHFINVDSPFSLGDGLELETRLTVLGNREDVTLREVESVDRKSLEPYLRDKLERVSGMSTPLARFDHAVLAGARISAYSPRFCGISSQLLDNNSWLKTVFSEAVESFTFLEDWDSSDIVSFYQAKLGIPLYVYSDISSVLEDSYDFEVGSSGRKQPLHIDYRWENEGFLGSPGPGMPGVTVRQRRQWERNVAAWRRKKDQLTKALQKEQAKMASEVAGQFARCLATGVLSSDTANRYKLEFKNKVIGLGHGIKESMDAFGALSKGIRGPVDRANKITLKSAQELIEQCLLDLDSLLFEAATDNDEHDVEVIELLREQLTDQGDVL